MVLKRISEMILSKSNSYNFYKKNYEKMNTIKNKNDEQLKQINELKEKNKNNEKEIERLHFLCEKYEKEIKKTDAISEKYKKDNEYLQSLLKFEIESIEKYMFELVELNKKDEK